MYKGTVRSPIAVILLSMVTCGIYGIYWFFKFTEEVNGGLGEKRISAGLYFFLSIICFPLYFVWMYKLDQAIFEIRSRYGMPAKKNFVLWLVLMLLGVGSIVFMYQVQDQMNEVWEKT
jgi:hypothetical protein